MLTLLISASAAAELRMPARLSGKMEDFALSTCTPHSQCYRIEAKEARPSLTGSADLRDLKVQILDLAGEKVLQTFSAPEGFWDSRTRTLVARGEPADVFLNLRTGELRKLTHANFR